jgi:hypothetical protein
MEVWSGDGWANYADVDNVPRRGVRVDHERALVLLHSVRDASGTLTRFTAEEAATALSSRQRRA